MTYTSRQEDLSPVVTYRHKRIIHIDRWISTINSMLKNLHRMKDQGKENKNSFPDINFQSGNDQVHFSHQTFRVDEKSDVKQESFKDLIDFNNSCLHGYITFLEAQREALIKEYNRLETAELPENGKEIQITE